MLPFRRKKKERHDPTPPIFKWLVVLFIAYAMYMNYSERQQKQMTDGTSVFGVGQQRNDGTALIRADFGTHRLPQHMTIAGDIAGVGEEARCGQTATVMLDEILPATSQTRTYTPAQQKALTVQIGATYADMPWVQALPGMQAQGIREISLLAGSFFSSEQRVAMTINDADAVRYRVQMQSITPTSDPLHIPFQAMDHAEGAGTVVGCGSTVEVHLALWNQDGTKAYDSREAGEKKPITLEVGKAQWFYGLDRSVLNMRSGGSRTVIVPPAYMALGSQTPHPLSGIVEPNRTYVMDVILTKLVQQ
jgi:FKBP-type peptidyl-prolyl cis-trans isomerase